MDKQLYFIRDGIHTHLVLPADYLIRHIPELPEYVGSASWLKVGWGDYRYYGAKKQTLLLALRALFLPTSAVIEAHGMDMAQHQLPNTAKLYAIKTSQQILEAVSVFVCHHFKTDHDRKLVYVRSKPSGELFFASPGIYTFLNTCNNWTSRGLYIAGLKLVPAIHFLPGQVEKSVRKNGYLPVTSY